LSEREGFKEALEVRTAQLETSMTSEALRLLRRNDLFQNSVNIDLDTERDDAVIAQALEQNQYVSKLTLLPAQRDANWDHLCQVLAAHRNLVHFVLFDSLRAPTERIRPILQAIQQNASIRIVEFYRNTWEAEDLCSFLDAARHVTDLTLHRWRLTGGQHGARDVAVALQRNTSIVTLKLHCCDRFLNSVLEGLVSNTCVRNLVIFTAVPLQEAGSNALQGLLESTRSIQSLELSSMFFLEDSFRPVAQGLIDSSTVEDITFRTCSFNGGRTIHHLNDILGRKQNLRSLAFKDCVFHVSVFLQALFSALQRPDSSLRDLEWDSCRFIDQSSNESFSLSNQSFSDLCQAVSESKLVSFAISVDHNQSSIQSLADMIPSMKIRELVVHFDYNGYQFRDHTLQTLRQALKNNFTLQSVKYQHDRDIDHFDASAEDDTMKFYLQRNIRLAKWVEDPATIPKHLWKEAMTLATKAGPEMLFRLLHKIGPEVLPVGSRKRKRSG